MTDIEHARRLMEQDLAERNVQRVPTTPPLFPKRQADTVAEHRERVEALLSAILAELRELNMTNFRTRNGLD